MIEDAVLRTQAHCSACGSVRFRFIDSSSVFIKCRSCGAVTNTQHRMISYSDSYFTDDYRAQYGKTYAEDFDNIYALSMERIRSIQKYISSKKGKRLSLLDIGCALGFFLKAAQDAGFSPVEGIEISQYASCYAREHFSFTITTAPFDSFTSSKKYDLISAWYVIEHFSDTQQTVKRVYSLLEPGGIFACSIPSAWGPSFLLHRSEWAASHPSDHRIDFTPYSIKKFLKKTGFRSVYVNPASIHTERIVKKSSTFFPIADRIYRILAHVVPFADTIEVYAVK